VIRPPTARSLRLLPVLVLCTLPLAALAQNAVMLRDLKVRLYCRRAHLNQIRSVLNACEGAVNRLFPHLPPAADDQWATVIVSAPGDETVRPLANLGTITRLTTDLSVQTVTDSCARALLERRLPAPVDDAPQELGWLAGAVSFEVLYVRGPEGLRTPDYSPLLTITGKRQFPSPAHLKEHPVLPRWPYAYRLYAMCCHATCEVLSATRLKGDTALAVFMDSNEWESDSQKAWDKLLRKIAGSRDEARVWLTDQIRDLVEDRKLNPSGDTLANRVRDSLGVAVLAPGPDGTMKYRKVPIQDLRERFPDARLDDASLAAKEERIFELLKDAPLILQRPLANYMGALQARKDGTSWKRFLDLLEKADADLQEGLRRYEGTLTTLDALERQYDRKTVSLMPFLDIVHDSAVAAQELAPETDKVLEGVP